LKSFLTVAGLIFTLLGAAVVARNELTSLAAQIANAEKIDRGPWYQNLAMWLARQFGSKAPLDQEDFGVPSFIAKFWGFFSIFLGTLLQVLGAL